MNPAMTHDAKTQDRVLLGMVPYLHGLKRLAIKTLAQDKTATFVMSQLPHLHTLKWCGSAIPTHLIRDAERYLPSLERLTLIEGAPVSPGVLFEMRTSSLTRRLTHLYIDVGELATATVASTCAAYERVEVLMIKFAVAPDPEALFNGLKAMPALKHLSLIITPEAVVNGIDGFLFALADSLPKLFVVNVSCRAPRLGSAAVTALVAQLADLTTLSLDIITTEGRFDWAHFFMMSMGKCAKLLDLRIDGFGVDNEASVLPVVPAKLLTDWLAATPFIHLRVCADYAEYKFFGMNHHLWFDFFSAFSILGHLPTPVVRKHVPKVLNYQVPAGCVTAPGTSSTVLIIIIITCLDRRQRLERRAVRVVPLRVRDTGPESFSSLVSHLFF